MCRTSHCHHPLCAPLPFSLSFDSPPALSVVSNAQCVLCVVQRQLMHVLLTLRTSVRVLCPVQSQGIYSLVAACHSFRKHSPRVHRPLSPPLQLLYLSQSPALFATLGLELGSASRLVPGTARRRRYDSSSSSRVVPHNKMRPNWS